MNENVPCWQRIITLKIVPHSQLYTKLKLFDLILSRQINWKVSSLQNSRLIWHRKLMVRWRGYIMLSVIWFWTILLKTHYLQWFIGKTNIRILFCFMRNCMNFIVNLYSEVKHFKVTHIKQKMSCQVTFFFLHFKPMYFEPLWVQR